MATTDELIQEVHEIAAKLGIRDKDVALKVAAQIQGNRIMAEQKEAASGLITKAADVLAQMMLMPVVFKTESELQEDLKKALEQEQPGQEAQPKTEPEEETEA